MYSLINFLPYCYKVSFKIIFRVTKKKYVKDAHVIGYKTKFKEKR